MPGSLIRILGKRGGQGHKVVSHSTGLLSLTSQIFRCRCIRNTVDETRTPGDIGTLRDMIFCCVSYVSCSSCMSCF